MKNKVILLLVFVTLPNLIALMPNSFAQETPQYFNQTMRMENNCPITHLYSTKFIVPVMIKVIHDPTPNFNVGSATNSTTLSSIVNFNGDDKYAFLVRTNSTGQFTILVKANYNDGFEHQIYTQYWSENQQVAIDQFSTLHGAFCHNFLVETAPPPPIIDIQKTIQNAEAQTFAQIIGVMSQDHDALGQLQVIVIGTLGTVIIVQIITMIFHNNEGRGRESDRKKLKQIENKFAEGARLLVVQNKHSALTDKSNQEKIEKFIQTILVNLDEFKSDIKEIVKNQNNVIHETFEPATPKTEPPKEMTKETPEIPLDEIEPITETIEVEPEPKKTGINKIVSSIQEHIGKRKKIMQKIEKKILTEDEWYKILKDEKHLTQDQALKAYTKLEKYVNGHPENVSEYNKLLAYYRIAVGDNQ